MPTVNGWFCSSADQFRNSLVNVYKRRLHFLNTFLKGFKIIMIYSEIKTLSFCVSDGTVISTTSTEKRFRDHFVSTKSQIKRSMIIQRKKSQAQSNSWMSFQ